MDSLFSLLARFTDSTIFLNFSTMEWDLRTVGDEKKKKKKKKKHEKKNIIFFFGKGPLGSQKKKETSVRKREKNLLKKKFCA